MAGVVEDDIELLLFAADQLSAGDVQLRDNTRGLIDVDVAAGAGDWDDFQSATAGSSMVRIPE